MSRLRKQLVQQLTRLPGVSEKTWPQRDDGFSSLQFNGKEFGHFHHDNEIDIRLTRALIAEHSLEHPSDSKVHAKRSKNSPWIEMRFFDEADINRIIKMAIKLLEQK